MSDSSPFQSRFLFVVCQAGAEKALKAELAREYPGLKAAFSRPGFVTFKSEEELKSAFELRSVFTRAYGLSLGKVDRHTNDRVAAVLERVKGWNLKKPVKLHVFAREGLFREENRFEQADQIRDALLKGGPHLLAENGQGVCDVVLVEEDEWWIGFHEENAWHSPFPGGNPRVALPEEAPSRAYLKLVEGLIYTGAPLRPSDVAVEIGSAPGGASWALLERGLKVIGIDPGEMDEAILNHPNFTHVHQPIASVRRESLPETIHWLLLDMNVAPAVTLFQVERLARRMEDTLLGVLLTVKLNEWEFAAQIPEMIAKLRSLGMVRIRATQLPSNKQEIFLYGLSRKGVARS